MNKEYFYRQNTFHTVLTTYINNCAITRYERFVSMLSLSLASYLHANTIVKQYQSLLQPVNSVGLIKYHIKPYDQNNYFVNKMKQGLIACKNDLVGAYIHGSLATNEDNKYSDFDALIIISDQAFSSPRRIAKLAAQLTILRKIMLDFDPLQHHGWFVITENDLRCYCDMYFPANLFQYSRSLYDDKGLTLNIQPRDSQREVADAFYSVINSITSRLLDNFRPNNMYQLKCFLSEFMLLPALYLQIRQKEGIYKKFSFDMARNEFNPELWQCMERASYIRNNWMYKLNLINKILLTKPLPTRRLITKYFSPPVPATIQHYLDDNFYDCMNKLCHAMISNIKDSN